jgi:hypothetical protein
VAVAVGLGEVVAVGVAVGLSPEVEPPPGVAVALRVGEALGSEADGEPEQAAMPAQAIKATTPKPAAVSLALSQARVACTFIEPPGASGRSPPFRS